MCTNKAQRKAIKDILGRSETIGRYSSQEVARKKVMGQDLSDAVLSTTYFK